MKTRTLLAVIIGQLWIFSSVQAQADILLNRYREYLFRTHQPEEEKVGRWSGTLDARGQWPDVEYSNKEPADWKVTRHLERIRGMALAWAHSQSTLYQNKYLKKAIDKALDHWLEKRYQNSNWWHNQIGVPRSMRDIIILLRDDLTPERLRQSLEVMAQLYVNEKATGANLIWPADLGLHYGALTGNKELVEHTRKLILEEIKITTGEGIQPDYSFHQHGPRLQMYQYGKAYLWESVRIVWQLRETPWAFPDEKVSILTGFALKGWQWMARGIYTVPGTMDRSATRVDELRAADLRPLISFMIELQPEKASAFKKMTAIQNGKDALAGFRYYPRSDFAAYHRPGFSFFLKTISNRTLTTESINGENLKGKLLNSGDAYLIADGNEYYNLMPVWDWTKLPGVTGFDGADHIRRKRFTGSVSDGESGLTAMNYHMTGSDSTRFLSARKIWACYGNIVVALIADLQTENIASGIYTALDQSRRRGEVTFNEPGNILEAGNHKIDHLRWVHHKNFAYIPLEPSAFNIRLNEVTGRWTSVNVSGPSAPVTEKVFLPVMLHETQPDGTSTGYVLAYAGTPEQAENLAAHPTWEVLRNDESCQAVEFQGEKLMTAFYAPGTLKTGDYDKLTVNKSCLILLADNKLYVSDPAHEGGPVNIRFNGKEWSIRLPGDGTTVILNL